MDLLEDLREVDRISWLCAVGKSRFMDGQIAELFDEARSGILENIATSYQNGKELTRDDLFNAGFAAISSYWDEPDKHSGSRARGFWADWCTRLPAKDTFEERLVERVAIHEVLSSMPLNEQETLLLLAAHGSVTSSAAHLGVSVKVMSSRTRKARARFFELWFDWEPAPPVPHSTHVLQQPATHCGRGHEFTPENTGKRAHKKTGRIGRVYRYCIACNRENANAHRARLKNQSTPKEGDQSS